MKLFYLQIAFAASLIAGTTLAQAFDEPFRCQEQIDQELTRVGFSDFVHTAEKLGTSSKSIDASAFVKNDVGQYSAYLFVDDAASKELIGGLLFDQPRDEAPADQIVILGDQKPPKMVLFLKGKRVVGFSSNLLAYGAGKSVLLNSQCQPVKVNVTLPPTSVPYISPVINLNRSDCSHLSELESIAKNVEIGEREPLFDGICRVRGGRVAPASHFIDDDAICECPARTIDPELEHWKRQSSTCLNPPRPSSADEFASLISFKGSLVNGGFQALVSQLKNPNSVIAQQCRVYYP